MTLFLYLLYTLRFLNFFVTHNYFFGCFSFPDGFLTS